MARCKYRNRVSRKLQYTRTHGLESANEII